MRQPSATPPHGDSGDVALESAPIAPAAESGVDLAVGIPLSSEATFRVGGELDDSMDDSDDETDASMPILRPYDELWAQDDEAESGNDESSRSSTLSDESEYADHPWKITQRPVEDDEMGRVTGYCVRGRVRSVEGLDAVDRPRLPPPRVVRNADPPTQVNGLVFVNLVAAIEMSAIAMLHCTGERRIGG